ncbi:hypothetical protein ILT44_01355 [Microvirga sp. BT689]|uniref:hypothetical protein n=1 Tax=Microvirga arvi TaxID=2778731 RepID=UPI0019528BBB|nr:hypothetical protein [Microvirga arvi]MBM6578811.1 hypothetical protein [Microvirga arvi]
MGAALEGKTFYGCFVFVIGSFAFTAVGAQTGAPAMHTVEDFVSSMRSVEKQPGDFAFNCPFGPSRNSPAAAMTIVRSKALAALVIAAKSKDASIIGRASTDTVTFAAGENLNTICVRSGTMRERDSTAHFFLGARLLGNGYYGGCAGELEFDSPRVTHKFYNVRFFVDRPTLRAVTEVDTDSIGTQRLESGSCSVTDFSEATQRLAKTMSTALKAAEGR